jgi:hypothetical protein
MSEHSYRVTGYKPNGGAGYDTYDSEFERRWFVKISNAAEFVAQLLTRDFDEESIEILEDTSEDGGYDGYNKHIFLSVDIIKEAKLRAEERKQQIETEKRITSLRQEAERIAVEERRERLQLERLKQKYGQ